MASWAWGAAASELALLAGAPGFTADSQLVKVHRDLNGLLYADGIHDSLYRTVGRTLTAGTLGLVIRSPGSCLPARSPSGHDRVQARGDPASQQRAYPLRHLT